MKQWTPMSVKTVGTVKDVVLVAGKQSLRPV